MNKALFFKHTTSLLTSTFSFVTGSSVTLFRWDRRVRGFSDNCSTSLYIPITKDIEGRCSGWRIGCGTKKNLTSYGVKTWTTSWGIGNIRSSAQNPSVFLKLLFRVGKLSVAVIRVPEARQHPVHSWNFISSKFLIEQPWMAELKLTQKPSARRTHCRVYFLIENIN